MDIDSGERNNKLNQSDLWRFLCNNCLPNKNPAPNYCRCTSCTYSRCSFHNRLNRKRYREDKLPAMASTKQANKDLRWLLQELRRSQEPRSMRIGRHQENSDRDLSRTSRYPPLGLAKREVLGDSESRITGTISVVNIQQRRRIRSKTCVAVESGKRQVDG